MQGFIISKSWVSKTRVAFGPRERFVRPTMLFGNFQITNIEVN